MNIVYSSRELLSYGFSKLRNENSQLSENSTNYFGFDDNRIIIIAKECGYDEYALHLAKSANGEPLFREDISADEKVERISNLSGFIDFLERETTYQGIGRRGNAHEDLADDPQCLGKRVRWQGWRNAGSGLAMTCRTD